MKKIILTIIVGVLCALTLVGCKKKSSDDEDTVAKLTLGEYKGVKVAESAATVTAEELKEYVDSVREYCSYNQDVTEGVLTSDMTVKVDYVSTIDGAEYTGGTQTDASLTLSSDTFKVSGVVEALIGKNVGDVVEVDSKYADDYSDESLKGKAVHFKITIKAIVKKIVPEYNDELVKSKFAYLGYSTTAELDEYLKKDLFINDVISSIWQGILDSCTVESYDSKELKEALDEQVKVQEYQIYSYTGYTLAQYLEAINQTEEDFRKSLEENVKLQLKNKMVINAIAEAENITVSDADYEKQKKEYAGNYGYDSFEEFSSAYSNYGEEDFKYYMLMEKVHEFVANKATPTPDDQMPTTTGQATTAQATTEQATTEQATTK